MKHLLTIALFLLSLLSAHAAIEATPLVECLCENGSAPQQAFQLTAEGTAGPFTFRWSREGGGYFPSDEQNPTDISLPGKYIVEVTNAYGCTFPYEIEIPACPTPTISGTTAETCAGQPTGSITVEVTGGAEPYTYIWSNGSGDTPVIAGLAEGYYYLTVQDSRGCRETRTYKVLAGSLGFTVNAAATPPSCFFSADGAIQLSIQPADAYTIAWSNGAAGASLSGLAAGSYTATVTDAYGCSVEETVVLPAPPPLTVFPEVLTPTTCPESADGGVELSVEGGTGPYNIAWRNGGAGPIAGGLAAGTYPVVVTDANGCTANTAVAVPAGPGMSIAAAIAPMACAAGPDGAVSLSVSGASGQLSYSWSGPEGPINENSAQLSGLPAGQYCATVTDGQGCVGSGCWVVEADAIEYPYIREVEVLVQYASGQEVIIYKGEWIPTAAGCLRYVRDESAGITTEVFEAILADEVEVKILAVSNIELELLELELAFIDFPALPALNIGYGDQMSTLSWAFTSPWPSSSLVQDGGINMELLFSGATLSGISILDLRAYTSNLQACVELPSIEEGCAWPADILAGKDDVHVLRKPCFDIEITPDAELGELRLRIRGATFPYDGYLIVWTQPGRPEFSVEGPVLGGIEGGRYCVTVRDQSGCVREQCVTYCSGLYGISVETYPTCPGQNGGAACILFQNGFSSEDVQAYWELNGQPVGGNSSCINELPEGTHIIHFELNYLECETINWGQSINIPTLPSGNIPLEAAIHFLQADCPSTGEGEGTACIYPSGWAPPYAYSWSDGGTGQCAEGLIAEETYTVTITDYCNSVEILEIAIPDIYEPLVINEPGIVTEDAICTSNTGLARIPLAGGKKPYTFSWASPGGGQSGGAVTSSNLISIGGLSAGDYYLTIADACGQSVGLAFSIGHADGPSSFQIVESTQTNPCAEDDPGAIGISVGGEQETGPFLYAWSNGAITEDVDNLAAGSYSVTITNRFGCVIERSFEVVLFQPLLTEKVTHVCGEGTNGELSITFVDGSGINTGSPYTFAWDNGASWEAQSGFYNNTLNGLAAGAYELTLTNSWGCERVYSFEVHSLPLPEITLADFQGATIHPINPSLDMGDGFLEIAIEGEGPFEILWNTGAATEAIHGLSAGGYAVTVTSNSNGCSNVEAFILPTCNSSALNVTSTPGQITPAIEGEGSIAINVSGGEPPYSFSWVGPNGYFNNTQNITGLAEAGRYCVSVKDNCGKRLELCREIVTECPGSAFFELTHNNNCRTDGEGPSQLILDRFYTPNRPSLVQLQWHSNTPEFSETEGLIYVDENGYQLISGVDQITVPNVDAVYYLTATDQYGCRTTAWAEFKAPFNYYALGARYGSGWWLYADVDELHDEHSLVVLPENIPLEEIFPVHTGLVKSTSCGCLFNGQWIDCYNNSSTFIEFCFHQSEPAQNENVCRAGGVLVYRDGGFAGFIEVPPNDHAIQATSNEGCGCVFPYEIFQENFIQLPYALYRGVYGPIDQITDHPLYAPCKCGSWVNDIVIDISVSINQFEQCYTFIEGSESCVVVDRSEVNGCDIVLDNGLFDNCAEGTLGSMNECPPCVTEAIRPCWCIDENTDQCKMGLVIYNPETGQDILMYIGPAEDDEWCYSQGIDECNCSQVAGRPEYRKHLYEEKEGFNIQPYQMTVQASVSPNPFTEAFYINLKLKRASNIQVMIMDIYGRFLYGDDFDMEKGYTQLKVDFGSTLPLGVYQLVISNREGYQGSFKIVRSD